MIVIVATKIQLYRNNPVNFLSLSNKFSTHWEYRSAAVSDLATMGVSNGTISPDL